VSAERDLVFFSYRHDADGERWLSALRGMLEPYVLAERLIAWSDRDIRTGDHWHTRIQQTLSQTRVAVLLVNQRFFGSEYIGRHELPRLIEDGTAGRVKLVCVLIGHCDPGLLGEHGLSQVQFGHDLKKPLSALRGNSREKVLVGLAMDVKAAFGSLPQERVPTRAQALPRSNEPAAPAVAIEAPSSEARSALGALLDVPPLNPNRYVAREDELLAIREQLLRLVEPTHGLTAGLGLHGMGGAGKSVMAQALCHDDVVRAAFPDGIAWVAVGQQPDLLPLQNRVLRLLAPAEPPGETVAEALRKLRAALSTRKVLLVVDDIWDARHFEQAFDAAGGMSRVLLTTRDASILSHIGARAHALQRLPDTLARQVLALRSHTAEPDLPAEADEVVRQAAGLPLALSLAGAQAADGVRWSTIVAALQQGRIDFLDHTYHSVYSSLGHSVDALAPAERDRYLELAVFPEDVPVPVEVIARLWWHTGGLDAAESERLLARLDRKALLNLQGEGSTGRTVALHDLQQDYLRLRVDDLPGLHGRFLDACRSGLRLPADPAGWAAVPADAPYIWPQLAMHLAAAGRHEELEACLLSRDWIAARLASETRVVAGRASAQLAALARDYTALPAGSVARQVWRALRMSSHVLVTHPEALDQMLYGRLGDLADPQARRLAQEALDTIEDREALAPTRAALQTPGPLEATLRHEGAVNGALLLPDGRRALSWSRDGTLRLWDLEQPGEPRVLAGHEEEVSGALLLPDGRRALSWSWDGTLRLWDLEQPGEPRVLAGHKGGVFAALLLPDGRRALSSSRDGTLYLSDLEQPGAPRVLAGPKGGVSAALLLSDGRRALLWAGDGTLRLWDLEQPGELRVLAGHEGGVNGAQLLPDGRRALSWSGDGTLRLWDLEQPSEPRVFAGHEGRVNGALLLHDDRRALSWSDDGTLRLWDLEQPGELRVLAGHEEGVSGALLLPDGCCALSWSGDGTLRLWDLEQPGEPRVLAGHKHGVDGALLLPDGRRAMWWSWDGTLRLWDLEQPGEPRVFAGHEGRVNGALLLHAGRRALSWSDDGTLRLWDLEQPGELRALAGHEEGVSGALLLPDGCRALSWSGDRTLRLWDLEQPGELRALAGHEEGVSGALLLPDGRRALSWSGDGTLRLWDLEGRSPTACYFADGSIGAVLFAPRKGRVFVGDATGRVQILRLLRLAAEPVPSAAASAPAPR